MPCNYVNKTSIYLSIHIFDIFSVKVELPIHHDLIIFPWPGSRECIPQDPGRIEYYNQLFCLRGGVSEIQTSLDVSDL